MSIITPELIERAQKAFPKNVINALKCIGDLDDPRMNNDVEGQINDSGAVVPKFTSTGSDGQKIYHEFFHPSEVLDAALLLAWSQLELPAGHPFLTQWPKALEKLRARFLAPTFMFQAAPRWYIRNNPDQKAVRSALGRLLEAYGSPVTLEQALSPSSKGFVRYDMGVVVIGFDQMSLVVAVRPSKVDGVDLDPLREVNAEAKPDHKGERFPAFNLDAVLFLLSPEAERIAARCAKTPVSSGGYEANPLQSVPQLVEEVMKKHELDRGSAALYLQLLALHAPTKKSTILWNEWTSKQYVAAAKRLVDVGLVVEDKRGRAGRAHFIDGDWDARKNPDIPLESSKHEIYGASDNGRAPLGQLLPLRPVHELFEQAPDPSHG